MYEAYALQEWGERGKEPGGSMNLHGGRGANFRHCCSEAAGASSPWEIEPGARAERPKHKPDPNDVGERLLLCFAMIDSSGAYVS